MANEMRDRLVELYAKAKRNMWGRTFHSDLERNMYIADYLIANDVVPVVRCKDCKHWNKTDTDVIVNIDYGKCTNSNSPYHNEEETTGGDYCSYGERRCSNESRTY